MSPSILDRSPDLQRLHEDCYELRITTGGHLVIDHVPYVTPSRSIAFGSLVSTLVMAGDHTANPVDDHSLYFEGEIPCDRAGSPLTTMLIETNQEQQLEAGLTVHHRFSCKPSQIDHYPDYHAKMTGYVAMLLTHARGVDPNVQATRAHPVVLPEDDPDPRLNTWIRPPPGPRCSHQRQAADAPSGDRRPGRDRCLHPRSHRQDPNGGILSSTATTSSTTMPSGAAGVSGIYRGAQRPAHEGELLRPTLPQDETTGHSPPVSCRRTNGRGAEGHGLRLPRIAAEEGGGAKRLVIEKLEEFGLPFIDVGLSVDQYRGSLGGMVCVTTSTPTQRDHLRSWVDLSDPDPDDIYDQNIQVADSTRSTPLMPSSDGRSSAASIAIWDMSTSAPTPSTATSSTTLSSHEPTDRSGVTPVHQPYPRPAPRRGWCTSQSSIGWRCTSARAVAGIGWSPPSAPCSGPCYSTARRYP